MENKKLIPPILIIFTVLSCLYIIHQYNKLKSKFDFIALEMQRGSDTFFELHLRNPDSMKELIHFLEITGYFDKESFSFISKRSPQLLTNSSMVSISVNIYPPLPRESLRVVHLIINNIPHLYV